jgi:polysaccharide biosynthesis transport protein
MLDDPEERVSISLEDIWSVARRRRWWLILPVFLCWAAVWGGSWLLPTTYQSEGLIVVERQKVPEHYVEPNVTVDIRDRLDTMTQQILSRTRLQTVIDSFHLYSHPQGLGRFMQAGDPVEQLRRDIKIELVQSPARPGDLTAFKIYYSGDSPSLAQQVNNQLTTLFIDENVKTEQQFSESTTSFLASQLVDARNRLEEQEAKMMAFQAAHQGELPGQLQSNAEMLTSLQGELENIQRSLDSANQQKLYLESQLQQFQSAKSFMGSGDAASSSPDSLDEELSSLRRRLADERSRHTDNYPEIISIKSKIVETEKLKKEVEAEIAARASAAKAAPSSADGTVDASGQTSSALLMQLRSQLKANTLEIENDQRRQKAIQAQIGAYQSKLRSAPEMEQELAEISRGYEESKTNYNSLLQKQNQSQLATSLAQRQQGEQFRVLDPPSLPEKAASPNHLLLSLAGLGIGAVLGICMVAFLELTNVRIRHEKDLPEVVPGRVLVCIPHLGTLEESHAAVATRKRELLVAAAMVVLIIAGNFYAFYKG